MIQRSRRILGVAAVVVLVGFIAGCKTTTTPGRQVDDATIKAEVKTKLAKDVRLSTLTNVEVNSTNGVVTLAGEVHNIDEKRAAEEVTRTVNGVVKVNNELQVKQR